MSTPHRYNTRSKKKMDAVYARLLRLAHTRMEVVRLEHLLKNQPLGPVTADHKVHIRKTGAQAGDAHKRVHNTRSTDISKVGKTALVLCNKALNTSWDERPNDRVEKMIEFMRWIRTHKRMLVIPSFKRTCYKKCHQYTRKATSTSVSKRVKSKLLKSLVYECSLILDIIENEF